MRRKTVPERTGLAPIHTRDVFYAWDVRGLMTEARFDSLAGEGVSNAYDGFGRLTSSRLVMDGTSRTLSHLYDAGSRRTRLTWPSGVAATFAWDAASRLTAIYHGTGTSGPVARFTYTPRGLVDVRSDGLTGGASVDHGYSAIGRLTGITHTFAGGAGNLTLGLGRNVAGQIVTLTRSNDAYVSNTAYDVSRTYEVNRLNQYRRTLSAGVPSATFAHDANGNLISDGTVTFTYDVENRLVAASGGATLRYDPLSRLYEVTGPSGTRRFVWDGDALVAEYDAAGILLERYVHGAAAGADDPLVWYRGSNRRRLHADHQGSIIAVTGSSGGLLAANAYDAWGIPNAANLGRFGYTGQIWLGDLGMYHYKARIYSPTLGRFLQVDPVGYEDQINLYAYVGNDPVNWLDPTGEDTSCLDDNSMCTTTFDAQAGPARQAPIVADNMNSQNPPFARNAAGTAPTDQAASEVNATLEQRNSEGVYRMDVQTTGEVTTVVSTRIAAGDEGRAEFSLSLLEGAEAAFHTEPTATNTGVPGPGDILIPARLGIPNYQGFGSRVNAIEIAGGRAQIRPIGHNNTSGLRERAREYQARQARAPWRPR